VDRTPRSKAMPSALTNTECRIFYVLRGTLEIWDTCSCCVEILWLVDWESSKITVLRGQKRKYSDSAIDCRTAAVRLT